MTSLHTIDSVHLEYHGLPRLICWYLLSHYADLTESHLLGDSEGVVGTSEGEGEG